MSNESATPAGVGGWAIVHESNEPKTMLVK